MRSHGGKRERREGELSKEAAFSFLWRMV